MLGLVWTSADSLAAMIAAAGLQNLAAVRASLENKLGAKKWLSGAQTLITQTAGYAWKPEWHYNGTRDNNANGNHAARSNNTGLPYADYFWIKNGNYLLEAQDTKVPERRTGQPCDMW